MASHNVIQRGVTRQNKQGCDNDRKHQRDRQTKPGLTRIATSGKNSGTAPWNLPAYLSGDDSDLRHSCLCKGEEQLGTMPYNPTILLSCACKGQGIASLQGIHATPSSLTGSKPDHQHSHVNTLEKVMPGSVPCKTLSNSTIRAAAVCVEGYRSKAQQIRDLPRNEIHLEHFQDSRCDH